MFGKVKKWLGIEGVKVSIDVADVFNEKDGVIKGKLLFHSLQEAEVEQVNVRLIEKYTRGRRKQKLVDEYTLGVITLSEKFIIKPEESMEMEFELPYNLLKSDVEKFGDKNFITKNIAAIAKFIRNAHSQFRLETEVKVRGVRMHPFDKRIIYFE